MWRNDAPKDECKVQLEGPEKEWWTGTEMGFLRAYWFAGHVTASDDSVGTGSMGAVFVWMDRSKCGSEHIGKKKIPWLLGKMFESRFLHTSGGEEG